MKWARKTHGSEKELDISQSLFSGRLVERTAAAAAAAGGWKKKRSPISDAEGEDDCGVSTWYEKHRTLEIFRRLLMLGRVCVFGRWNRKSFPRSFFFKYTYHCKSRVYTRLARTIVGLGCTFLCCRFETPAEIPKLVEKKKNKYCK